MPSIPVESYLADYSEQTVDRSLLLACCRCFGSVQRDFFLFLFPFLSLFLFFFLFFRRFSSGPLA